MRPAARAASRSEYPLRLMGMSRSGFFVGALREETCSLSFLFTGPMPVATPIGPVTTGIGPVNVIRLAGVAGRRTELPEGCIGAVARRLMRRKPEAGRSRQHPIFSSIPL